MKHMDIMTIRLPRFLFFLYLFPIFVANIDMGPAGEIFLRSQFIIYPFIILTVLSLYESKKLILFFTFSVLLLIFYVVMLLFGYLEGEFKILMSWLIYLLYILTTIAIAIVAKSTGWHEFRNIFEVYIVGVVVLIFLSYIVWKSFGVYFLADDGYGYHRPHALFSEPSACSLFLCYGFLKSYSTRQYFNAFFVLVAIFISGSLLALIIAFLVFIYKYLNDRPAIYVLVFLTIVFSFIYVGYDQLVNYSPTGAMWDSQILRLRQAVISIETLGEDGYNPRLNTAVDMFVFMNEVPLSWLIGFGPGADTYLPFSDVASSGSSIITLLLFNFGFACLVAYFIFTVILINRIVGGTSFWFFAVSVFSTTALNSAQGLLIYQLILFVLFLGFNYEETKLSSSRSGK